MPFATTWMNIEITILSKVKQRQISYDITYIWNLIFKKDTNELIYKTGTVSEKLTDIENKLMVTKKEREGKDELGLWD